MEGEEGGQEKQQTSLFRRMHTTELSCLSYRNNITKIPNTSLGFSSRNPMEERYRLRDIATFDKGGKICLPMPPSPLLDEIKLDFNPRRRGRTWLVMRAGGACLPPQTYRAEAPWPLP